MSNLSCFTGGMRAYHGGDYADAARLLGPMASRPDLPGRMARYYCAMAHRALGIELIGSADFVQAKHHLREAVALVGKRADLAEYLLTAYAGAGDYDRCASQAELLSSQCPDDVAPRVAMAQAQWRCGHREEAVMTLTRALRELGDDAGLHTSLALFYAGQEQFDLARDHLRRAVECDCTSVAAHRCLGLVESARGAFVDATRAFGRALALDPSNLSLAYELCQASGAAGRAGTPVTVPLPEPTVCASTSQVQRLAEYVAGEPDFVEAFLALPASASDRELFGVLLTVLQVALGAHADYADLHYLAGVTLVRLGDDEAARGHFYDAVRINPRYVKALLAVAELEARQDAAERAVAHLQRALAAGADYPDVHARLGELLKQLGMVALAKEHFHRALELNRRYHRAAVGLASVAA